MFKSHAGLHSGDNTPERFGQECSRGEEPLHVYREAWQEAWQKARATAAARADRRGQARRAKRRRATVKSEL